jgi:hypothetical protein
MAARRPQQTRAESLLFDFGRLSNLSRPVIEAVTLIAEVALDEARLDEIDIQGIVACRGLRSQPARLWSDSSPN